MNTHAMMTRSKARAAAAAANDMYDVSGAEVAALARGYVSDDNSSNCSNSDCDSDCGKMWHYDCPWCNKTAHIDNLFCIITQHNDDCPGADNCCGDCEGDDVCRECEITYFMDPI
jgi:hypothetical protein